MRDRRLIALGVRRWGRVLIVIAVGCASLASHGQTEVWTSDCPTDRPEFRRINVGAVTLHVGCLGIAKDDKPTLVFLHGFPEYWASWEEVASILAKKFRVVLPDQRGYNLSDKPLEVSQYQLQDLVGDVESLIASVSPTRPVILIGHDLGGLVAYAAAAQLPAGRIAGLVIANAPHPNVFQQLFLTDLAGFPPAQGQLAASSYLLTFFPSDACPMPGLCPSSVPEAYYSNPNENGDLDDPDAADYFNLIRLVQSWGGAPLVDQSLFEAWNRTPGPTNGTHLTSVLNWYRAILPLVFEPLPEFTVNVPTLVLWGTEDVVLVEANIDLGAHAAYPGAQTLDAFIPDLKVEKYTDAGHFVQHEQPVEVAAEIKKLVDKLSAASDPK